MARLTNLHCRSLQLLVPMRQISAVPSPIALLHGILLLSSLVNIHPVVGQTTQASPASVPVTSASVTGQQLMSLRSASDFQSKSSSTASPSNSTPKSSVPVPSIEPTPAVPQAQALLSTEPLAAKTSPVANSPAATTTPPVAKTPTGTKKTAPVKTPATTITPPVAKTPTGTKRTAPVPKTPTVAKTPAAAKAPAVTKSPPLPQIASPSKPLTPTVPTPAKVPAKILATTPPTKKAPPEKPLKLKNISPALAVCVAGQTEGQQCRMCDQQISGEDNCYCLGDQCMTFCKVSRTMDCKSCYNFDGSGCLCNRDGQYCSVACYEPGGYQRPCKRCSDAKNNPCLCGGNFLGCQDFCFFAANAGKACRCTDGSLGCTCKYSVSQARSVCAR